MSSKSNSASSLLTIGTIGAHDHHSFSHEQKGLKKSKRIYDFKAINSEDEDSVYRTETPRLSIIEMVFTMDETQY